MKILMTGATGLIGQKLGLFLVGQGHEMTVISRNSQIAKRDLPFPCEVIEADLMQTSIRLNTKFDVVINLMGESVAKGRWTDARKKLIVNSRVNATRHLIESLAHPPKMILGASAIGFYGSQNSQVLTEESSAGSDFLAGVCQSWEKELLKAEEKFGPQTKLNTIRIGIVLSRSGGALEKLLFPFRAGVGGALANGKQMMSWIHIEDLVRMFSFIIEQNLAGTFNAVAPRPVSNLDFSKSLSSALSRPLGFRIPAVALKLLLGEFSTAVLGSQNVSSEKIIKQGFQFKFENIDMAFRQILEPFRSSAEVFESEQFVPHKKDKIFEFFSQAKNLESLTPKTVRFQIRKMSTPEINLGTLIDYRIQVRGVPIFWRTLIDEWNPDSHFVDVQLKGPYSLWRHTHEFVDLPGGTLVRDCVHFRLPAGFLGWLFAGFYVRADVKKIFAFRRKVIFEKFCSNL